MFPGSQLWHTAGIGLVLPLFPELVGPLRNAVLAVEGAVCSFQVEQVSCFCHGVAQVNASLPWDPWDLAQSLEEDLICKLQQRGGFNLKVEHVIGYANPSPIRTAHKHSMQGVEVRPRLWWLTAGELPDSI